MQWPISQCSSGRAPIGARAPALDATFFALKARLG
jgi:hypothetical protein